MTKPFTERDREPYTRELPDIWRARAKGLAEWQGANICTPRERMVAQAGLEELADELSATLQRDNDDCAAAHLEAANAAREDVLREFEALAAAMQRRSDFAASGEGAFDNGSYVAHRVDAEGLRALIAKLRAP